MKLEKLLSEDGYSFIEIFVTILIIALISSLLLVNANSISKYIFRGKENLAIKYDLINLRSVLREESQKIQPPWFLREVPVENSEGEFKIYYYNGDSEDYLILSNLNNEIIIRNKDKTLFYSNNLDGSFVINSNTLTYVQEKYEFSFNFGVLLA